MTATSALLDGRALALSLMVDKCTITVSGEPTLDPVTLQLVTSIATLYAGPCQVSGTSQAQSGTAEVEGRLQYEQARTFKVPVEVVGVPVGATITVTAAALDQEMVGRSFTVRAVEHKSFITSRRITAEEVTA